MMVQNRLHCGFLLLLLSNESRHLVDSLVAAEGRKIGLQLCGIQGKKLGTATK
jgi:hypothetical protein